MRPSSRLGQTDKTALHRAIFETLRSLVWGEVRPQSYPVLSTEVSHEALERQMDIRLIIEAHRSKANPEPVRHCISRRLGDTVWERQHPLEQVLRDIVSDIQSLSIKGLAEQDPRIGWGITKTLPSCPLFDTAGYTLMQKMQKEFGWTGVHVDNRKITLCCTFCGELLHEDCFWGGSNVGWVHKHCYCEVTREACPVPRARACPTVADHTMQIYQLVDQGILPSDFLSVK
jgi:hypothetical protein